MADVRLTLDGATGRVSCALWHNGVLLGAAFDDSNREHAQVIAPLVRGLLAAHGAAPERVAAIGVTRGPGAFTAVRAVLAFAEGWRAGAPHVAVRAADTTAVLAHAAPADGFVIAAVDARRGQLYAALYGPADAAGLRDVRLAPTAYETAAAVAAAVRNRPGTAPRTVHVAGFDGGLVAALAEHGFAPVIVADAVCDAVQLGRLLDARTDPRDTDTAPVYGRASQAERNAERAALRVAAGAGP